MTNYEVPTPILNAPFEEPLVHWYIREGRSPEKRPGRRPAIVFTPEEQREPWDTSDGLIEQSKEYPGGYELVLVNRIREQLKAWREAGYPGATRTTLHLLEWWRREGRRFRLFFAQLEAAETVIFLREARGDFLQGLTVPREEVPADSEANGGFLRYASKMATGTGKTTVQRHPVFRIKATPTFPHPPPRNRLSCSKLGFTSFLRRHPVFRTQPDRVAALSRSLSR